MLWSDECSFFMMTKWPFLTLCNEEGLYVAAIVPPESLTEELHNIKVDFYECFGSNKALRNPPHVTLIPPFFLAKEQEETFIDCFVHLPFQPFDIPINDYGFFKGNRVVFINSILNNVSKTLHEQVNARFKQCSRKSRWKTATKTLTLMATFG